MVYSQTKVFFIFMIVGIIISCIFDIFRIFRKVYKFSDIMIYMQDILFWLISGIIVLKSIFSYAFGSIRLYIFFGIFIGVFIYACLISTFFIQIGTKLLKITNKLIKIFAYPFYLIYNIAVKGIKKIKFNFKNTTYKKKLSD